MLVEMGTLEVDDAIDAFRLGTERAFTYARNQAEKARAEARANN